MERIKRITWVVWGERHKILRYLFSGGIGATVAFFFLYTLTEWLGFYYLVSTILAFVLGVIVSFILQKFLTFQNYSRDNMRRQVLIYITIAIFNTSLNTLLVYLFVEYLGLHYLVAQFFSSGLIAFESFFIYQIFIFKSNTPTV